MSDQNRGVVCWKVSTGRQDATVRHCPLWAYLWAHLDPLNSIPVCLPNRMEDDRYMYLQTFMSFLE